VISIVIPTLNEAGIIEKTLKAISQRKVEIPFEIIVSDGNSSDGTVAIASRYAKTISGPRGRGLQLNRGASIAKYNILFFMHADMGLPPGTLKAIKTHIVEKGFDGGGFSNIFSSHNSKIKRLGRFMNFRRNNQEQRENTAFFGDNGIFVKKNVFFKLGGFKPLAIMEDFEFSKRLSKAYRVERVKTLKLVVSPRRHLLNGFIKTRLQWIMIKKLFCWGISPDFLARWYKAIR